MAAFYGRIQKKMIDFLLECRTAAQLNMCCFMLFHTFSHLKLRPLKMEVEEPFNIRVRLFVFPGAGDSVAGWIQFVNKVGNLRVVDFFDKVEGIFFVTKSQD